MIIIKNILKFELSNPDKDLLIVLPEHLLNKKEEITSKLNTYYKIWIDPKEFIADPKERNRVYNSYCEDYLIERLNKSYKYNFSSTVANRESEYNI